MDTLELILYTRSGCCLCEGLEEKLKAIDFANFSPQVQISIKDIDGSNVSKEEREHYSMEVPVLAIRLKGKATISELPRVSPRLNKEDFLLWLQKRLCEKISKEKGLDSSLEND